MYCGASRGLASECGAECANVCDLSKMEVDLWMRVAEVGVPIAEGCFLSLRDLRLLAMLRLWRVVFEPQRLSRSVMCALSQMADCNQGAKRSLRILDALSGG